MNLGSGVEHTQVIARKIRRSEVLLDSAGAIEEVRERRGG